MHGSKLIVLLIILALSLGTASVGFAVQKDSAMTADEAFLEKASEDQELEIFLGELATEKASNDWIKRLGARMIEDHIKANEEIKELALREGIPLPHHLSEKDKAEHTFSHLSGKQFDRAYIAHMLGDHMKDIQELEDHAKTLQEKAIKEWASTMLPIFKEHVQEAKTIATVAGAATR